MNCRRSFGLVVTFLVSISFLIAQNVPSSNDPQRGRSRATVKVVLKDSLSKDPVEFATVSLRHKDSTNAYLYSLSDVQGMTNIVNVPFGEYLMKAELMGYNPVQRIINVTDREMDAGVLYMSESAIYLEAASITAVGNPIIVKKDTIEYNASSYKITDNDMLEDLLKKLPGVEIDSDGKITAGGKEITKITIDGKTFFLDDPQLATKNIPAKIINKVKVVDKKSDQAEFTGIDDGEEETIIDLSIAPGMLKGWFGNLSGGYGTDNRFQGAGMVGRFTDKDQISFVGNGNNTNNRGFADMQGDMMRSMRSSGGGMGGGGMWGMSGITTSWMGGANLNTTLLDNNMKLGGNYLYSGSENILDRSRDRTDMRENYMYNTLTNNYNVTNSDGHRVGAEMDWKLSDNTSILFRPRVNFGTSSFSEESTSDSYNVDYSSNNRQLANKSTSLSTGDNSSWQTRGNLLFRQKLGKAGRTLSLNVDFNFSRNEMDGLNKSERETYDENGLVVNKTITDQIYSREESTNSLAGRLTYTEPLGKNFFLEASYRYSFRETTSDKVAYNWNDATQRYDVKDDTYSNQFENLFINQDARLNVMKQEQKYNVQLGVSAQPSYTKSMGSSRDYENNVLNFAPNARFDYRFSDNNTIRFNYRGYTNQPSITQLQPVPDNSNPSNITLGNPNLLPEFYNRFNIDYRFTNLKTFSTFNVGGDFSMTNDKIVNASWYDSNNVRYTAPINSDGVISASARLMFNSPIAKSKFSVNSWTSARLSKGLSYSAESDDTELTDAILEELMKNKTTTTSLSLYESLRFVYRDDKIEANLGASVNFQNAWYDFPDRDSTKTTWTNSLNASFNWTLPYGFNLVSDGRYTTYIGYEDSFNKPQFVWNAEVSKLLFKNKVTLRVKIYDILNQSRSINTNSTDTYIEEVMTNTLGRYVMFSFTWRFGNFNNLPQGGPGRRGPGGPHMRR